MTARETGKRREKVEDDETLLAQIQETSPEAGAQFLEHLVLQKRTSVRLCNCEPLITTADAAVLVQEVTYTVCYGMCRTANSFLATRFSLKAVESQNIIIHVQSHGVSRVLSFLLCIDNT